MKYSFAFLFFALVLGACQTDKSTSPDSLTKSARGYGYELIKSGQGEPGNTGDEIYFDFEAVVEDTVLYDSRNAPMPTRFMLPDQSQINEKSSPLLDVLPLMGEADSLVLYVPMDSLPTKPAGFEDSEYMVYKIFMNFILREDASARDREQTIAELVAESAKSFATQSSQAVDIGDGVRMILHEAGSGADFQRGDRVIAHYYGVLADGGNEFDNSFKKGKPFTFSAGRGEVIRGWDHAVLKLKKGSKASIYIPSEMGYGARANGSIPPDSDLIFYLELLDI